MSRKVVRRERIYTKETVNKDLKKFCKKLQSEVKLPLMTCKTLLINAEYDYRLALHKGKTWWQDNQHKILKNG